MLQSISNCCKAQKMSKKAADYYPHALEYVLDCCMTQEMCKSC